MKLLSFGEIVWDIFGEEKHLGGAPLNFALFTDILGFETRIVSAVGEDELGKSALQQIKKFGIDVKDISVLKNKETGKCLVTLNEKAVPQYKIFDNVAYDYIKVPEKSKQADVLAFGTLALRRMNNREVVLQLLRENKWKEVFADLNIRAPFYSKESIKFAVENATIVKISEEELPIVTEMIFGKEYAVEDFSKVLSEKFAQIKLIIITKGKDGSFCYDCLKKKSYYCSAEKTKVVSTVGAGDSFGASFLCKYMKGEEIEKCLTFASKISAIVCNYKEAVPTEIKYIIKTL